MKRRDVFERTEPRPGGLARLRMRLDRDRARARARWVWVTSGAALAALVVLGVLTVRPSPRSSRLLSVARVTDGPSEVALGLARAPTETLSLGDESVLSAVLLEVPARDPHVRMYRVSTLGD